MRKHHVDPEVTLARIRSTLRRVRRHFFHSAGPVYKAWGAAWLVAFCHTYLVEAGLFGETPPGALIGWAWVVIMGCAGLYTVIYYSRQPVETAYGTRFGLAWPAAFTLMACTVPSMAAAGLEVHGLQFGVFAVYTVAVIYLFTGAILLDNLQVAVGLWIGVANIVGLQWGPTAYNLVMAVMVGGGLIVAGFIEDRIQGLGGEKP